jgi:Uma2 family endonuclease
MNRITSSCLQYHFDVYMHDFNFLKLLVGQAFLNPKSKIQNGITLGIALGAPGMTVTLYKWTLDRYHAAIDAGLLDDQPVELLKGDIVVMTPEREPHACYSSDGAEYLRRLLGDRASVRETKPVTLPDHSEPLPDVAIVQPPLRRYLEHHPYPEDIFWLIEYANTTLAKDLGEKKQVYAEAGIREYWVADLKNAQLKVFRDLVKGDYQTELTLRAGIVSPLSFQDVVVDVRRLFS